MKRESWVLEFGLHNWLEKLEYKLAMWLLNRHMNKTQYFFRKRGRNAHRKLIQLKYGFQVSQQSSFPLKYSDRVQLYLDFKPLTKAEQKANELIQQKFRETNDAKWNELQTF
jgi:hypothetical protein